VTPAPKNISRQKGKTLEESQSTERRGTVGDDSRDDDLNVDQHLFFLKGQHNQERKKERNLQWMDTLTGHTSCAAGSDSHGQHPSLDAPVSARPAEWELVSPPVQHNGAGSSSADTMRMNRELFNYNTNSIWTVTSLLLSPT